MKKILSLIITIVFTTLLACISVLAIVNQSEDFYVADYANILASDTKNDIIGYNGALEYQCKGAQVVVVTIESLGGNLDSEEYAHQLFNDWGVGAAVENNGMLLLLVTEEKKGWLALGAGLTDLSGEEINAWLDEYFWVYVDADKHDEGVNSIFMRILEFYDEYYGSHVIASHPDYVAPSYTQPLQPVYTPEPVSPQDVLLSVHHERVLWITCICVGAVGFIFWFIAPFMSRYYTNSIAESAPVPRHYAFWHWLAGTGGFGGGLGSGGFGGGSGSGGGGSSGGGGGGRK